MHTPIVLLKRALCHHPNSELGLSLLYIKALAASCIWKPWKQSDDGHIWLTQDQIYHVQYVLRKHEMLDLNPICLAWLVVLQGRLCWPSVADQMQSEDKQRSPLECWAILPGINFLFRTYIFIPWTIIISSLCSCTSSLWNVISSLWSCLICPLAGLMGLEVSWQAYF